MSNIPPDDLARITDYVAGELAPDDIERTETWIAEDGARQELVAYLRRSQSTVRAEQSVRATHIDIDNAIGAIAARIAKPSHEHGQTHGLAETNEAQLRSSSKAPGSRSNAQSRTAQRWVWSGLGVATLAAAIGVVTQLPWRSKTTSTTGLTETREYVTRRGEQAAADLSDGSHVILGPDAKVRFTAADGAGVRMVDLKGEAYFRVTPDHRPFIVRVGLATATVLGTEFMVRKYASDETVRVFVASGKVSIRSATKAGAGEAVATANTLVQVSDSGQLVVTPGVATEDELGWVNGRIVFRDASVATAMAEVSRRYDLDIRYSDSAFTSVRLNAVLDKETTNQALNLLAIALNAHYTREGRHVTFTPTRHVLRSTPSRRIPIPSEYEHGR